MVLDCIWLKFQEGDIPNWKSEWTDKWSAMYAGLPQSMCVKIPKTQYAESILAHTSYLKREKWALCVETARELKELKS